MTVNTRSKKVTPSIMIMTVVFIMIAAVFVIRFLIPVSNPLDTASTVALVKNGEKVFVENCQSCHGVTAIGEDPQKKGGGEKPEGGYFAPALNGTGHAWHHPDKMLFDTIKKGSLDETSQMKGFKEKLSDEEVVSVIYYFQSLWPKEFMERRNQKPN